LTWGDGVSDVDLKKLLAFHRSHGKLATLTAVRPPARYGHLRFDEDRVMEFTEKPQTELFSSLSQVFSIILMVMI